MLPADTAREALIEVGRYLDAHGLVTSHGGNLSVRRAAGGALISATGAMLGRLDGSRLVAVHDDGTLVRETASAPSSNTDIHLAIYARHPQAQAIVHAHPPHAVARTLAFDGDVLHPSNFEARLVLGSVPVVTAEGPEVPEAIARALDACPVVLVRGHGSFAMAADPWQALNCTSALEEAAQILTLAGDAVLPDGTPLRRNALLTLERDAHRRWLAVVEATAPSAVREDGWRLQDVAAHVAAWHRFAVRRLGQVERGEPREPVDVDAFNARVLEESRGRAWSEVRAEAEAAHAEFLAALASIPRSVLEDDAGFGAAVVAVNGFGHYAEHVRDFERR